MAAIRRHGTGLHGDVASGDTPMHVDAPPKAAGTAALALVLSVVLGVLADRLLWAGPRGPGFVLWIAGLGVATVRVARRGGADWVPAAMGWSALATAAAWAVVVRDAGVATLAMWLVVLTSGSMVVLRAGGKRLGFTRPSDHIVGFALAAGRAAVGVVPLLGDVEAPRADSRRRLTGLARGALLAVPLLLVFGALFASADAGFSRYVQRATSFWSDRFLAHVALTLAFAWVTGGLLSGVRARRLPDPLEGTTPPRLGTEETAVVFGLLAALFLVFVFLQLGYLFGGRETIEATSGLTVAEYARRGFFELMVVGIATIGVLLAGDAVTTARRIFRVLAGVLIVCVLVILASAAQRLALYTESFGLTVDRITAATVMAWVAVTLVLFAATVLVDRPTRFASGAVLAGIVAAFALVAVDPGALSARSNLDGAAANGRAPDIDYLLGLQADAVPILVDRFDELPPAGRCVVARHLLARWVDPVGVGESRELDDWRTWNAAQAAARDAVVAAEPALRGAVASCAPAESGDPATGGERPVP